MWNQAEQGWRSLVRDLRTLSSERTVSRKKRSLLRTIILLCVCAVALYIGYQMVALLGTWW